eukprot:CAMPEP_0181225396 /NCGR_PEP_ID=MMETSP1096-20121128/31666_1 /TAXON_ID=156174 ORGANISM="Chrysochromulina ericina, Strain CCMP281" /NCGR_SAMPLE_ID=MMETSP1096 /ASSEMBLY_ACC=CAM_ASM_000453 /LENGTH=35 /DNA_ID= /DNA_START= /DNA_END= /DNA_ORIENTATION=
MSEVECCLWSCSADDAFDEDWTSPTGPDGRLEACE